MTPDPQRQDNAPLRVDECPEINPLYIFRWEEKEQSFLLLYPEGIIKLNGPAGHILSHCDGEKTLEKIITDLEELFGEDNLTEDVYSFMEVALGKGWIRIKA